MSELSPKKADPAHGAEKKGAKTPKRQTPGNLFPPDILPLGLSTLELVQTAHMLASGEQKSKQLEEFFPEAAEVLKKAHRWLSAKRQEESGLEMDEFMGWKEHPFSEIAKRMGVTVKWVRTLIRRAFPNDYGFKLRRRGLNSADLEAFEFFLWRQAYALNEGKGAVNRRNASAKKAKAADRKRAAK